MNRRRTLTIVALALPAWLGSGCGNDQSVNDASVDAAIDASTCSAVGAGAPPGTCGCPDQEPGLISASPCASGLKCDYGSDLCICNNGALLCNPKSCPADNSAPTGPCSSPGLTCQDLIGTVCRCYEPEGQWFCCGDSPSQCPTSPTEQASLCCGRPMPGGGCHLGCQGGSIATCQCTQNRWLCQTAPCPMDMALAD